MNTLAAESTSLSKAHWGAVFAMSLGAFALIASEFMPVSLLTPIASDLQSTEGQAGQAIAFSGFFALITSVFITSVAGQMDRKWVLLSLITLVVISGTIVATAPNYVVFMLGRALIGIAIGGFWSLSAATAMRLVPSNQIPKALSIVNGGNALATVLAAPLGSFLGGIIGWRGAFFAVVPIAIITFCWLFFSLPSMKPQARPASRNIFKLLQRPHIAIGMAAVCFFFMGQFSLFTYIRPYLETVIKIHHTTLSLVLLLMGVSGFLGTLSISAFLKQDLYRVLIYIPILMGTIAIGLISFGNALEPITMLLMLWAFLATAAPVAWWVWLAQSMPNEVEQGGGLFVAVVQLAIAIGATSGGILFDQGGFQATFTLSVGLLGIAAYLAYWNLRLKAPHVTANNGVVQANDEQISGTRKSLEESTR